MQYENVAIPLGFAWSSPFVRWQGSLAEVPSTELAAAVTTRALADRHLDPDELAGLVLGWSVPQIDIFYGAPTLAGRIGAPGITGPMISQACATSVASLHAAAGSVQGGAGTQLVVTTDRTSNGPLLVQPSPSAPGGTPRVQAWVTESFACDPWAGTSMLVTAENVARELGASRAQADEVAVLRSEQYAKAQAGDIPSRYLVPIEIPQGRRTLTVAADEGVRPLTAEAAPTLPPVEPDGVHTYGSQTHPADGTAGCIVTTRDRAAELAGGAGMAGVAEILATGFARVGKSRMPQAPVPAAYQALADAGLTFDDVHAVTTHNPFAVNDLWFSAQTGYPLERMNAYGCSLVFGHPQAPTGMRSIAELIVELTGRGGGIGLFSGCAAGDTAAALVVRVSDSAR